MGGWQGRRDRRWLGGGQSPLPCTKEKNEQDGGRPPHEHATMGTVKELNE